MAEPTEPETENKTKALARVETSTRGLVLNNLEDMKTVSQLILQSGLAPDSFKTSAQIFVGLQAGAEIGLKPMQALNSIVVIKGKPTLWGDAALALVKRSGLLLEFTEKMTGEGDDMAAFVKSVRDDGNGRECLVETFFSVADAKEARLWGKQGPWTTHKKRMLKYKARAFNLRDNFPDILFGMHLAEEMVGEEPLPAPESDVLPREQRRSLAVPSSTVDGTRAPVQETAVVDGDLVPVDAEAEVKKPDPDAEARAKEANKPQEKPGQSCNTPTGTIDNVKTFDRASTPTEVGREYSEPEPPTEEKVDLKSLYVEVNGMYVAQNGQDFIEFASYVLCLDDSEVSPSKLTVEQLKQIKAYIETSGVAIN